MSAGISNSRRRRSLLPRHLPSPSRLASSMALLALFAGCMNLPADRSYKGPELLPIDLRVEYSYSKLTGEYSEEVVERNPLYTVRRIGFPSGYNLVSFEHNITLDYYQLPGSSKAPVVMVLPILGGSNGIAKSFAAFYAANGYAAVLVHRQKGYKRLREFDQIEEILQQIIIDHRRAIDWIETRPELDPYRIGVFGISMGGIKAALVSAIEQRIRASVIVMAGGDLPYILSHSREDGIAKRRKQIQREKNLTRAEFEAELRKTIATDPMHYGKYIDADRVLMVLARFDDVVPYDKGWQLRQQIGGPETVILFSGHYTAAFYNPFVKFRSLNFFDRKLGRYRIDNTMNAMETRQTSAGEE